MVEWLAVNQTVGGSSPPLGASFDRVLSLSGDDRIELKRLDHHPLYHNLMGLNLFL